jgi:hypothetical protein
MMSTENDCQYHIRDLKDYKLFLQLNSKKLGVKLFSKEKAAIYHSGFIEHKDLTCLFAGIFNTIEEAYKEFILTNEKNLSFNFLTG